MAKFDQNKRTEILNKGILLINTMLVRKSQIEKWKGEEGEEDQALSKKMTLRCVTVPGQKKMENHMVATPGGGETVRE